MSDTDNKKCSASITAHESEEGQIKSSYGLEFDVRRSIRYHSKRKKFFEKLDHSSKIIGVVVSTSAFSVLLGGYDFLTKLLVFITALISVADICICFSKKIDQYDKLQKRFSNLLVKIISKPNFDAEDLIEWEKERLTIEDDEPEPLKVMNIYCHNEECIAQGRDEYVYEIPKVMCILKNFISFDSWRPKR